MLEIKKINDKIYSIKLNGDLDFSTATKFVTSVEGHIKDCDVMYIDFINISMIDSSVIGGIISLYSTYKCNMHILNANDTIIKVFIMLNLHKTGFLHFIKEV